MASVFGLELFFASFLVFCVCNAKCDLGCLSGWSHYKQNNTCIRGFNHSLTWEDSRKFCWIQGGDLVKVDSLDKQIFLQDSKIDANIGGWIGLKYSQKIREFAWLDENIPTKFKNLIFHNANEYYRCVTLLPNKLSWKNHKCDSYRHFTCETEAKDYSKEGKENVCPPDWVEGVDSCYKVYTTAPVNWKMAEEMCKQEKAHLAVITNDEENNLVSKIVINATGGTGNAWIGLNNVETTDSLEWADTGAVLNYTNWEKGEPNMEQGLYVCGAIGGDNPTWCTRSCFGRSRFLVCEKEVLRPDKTQGHQYEECRGGVPCDDKCYQAFNSPKKFDDSQKVCLALGGNLATVTDGDVQDLLVSQMTTSPSYWVGLTNTKAVPDSDVQLYVYKWMSGHTMTYENWDQKHIVNHMTGPATCPGGWFLFDKEEVCLNYFTSRVTWDDARRYCQEYDGGDLIRIDTKEKQEMFAKYNTQWEFWIGLHRYKTNSFMFSWQDDTTPATYLNWNTGEPNNSGGSQNCTKKLRDSGKWDDVGCSTRLPYVCEMPAGHAGNEINTCVAMKNDDDAPAPGGWWYSYLCSEAKSFICEFSRPGQHSPKTPTTSRPGTTKLCPREWINIGNVCYKIAWQTAE